MKRTEWRAAGSKREDIDGRVRPPEMGRAISRARGGTARAVRLPGRAGRPAAEEGPGARSCRGTGRHALWLARRGLDVTLADISGVALEVARAEACREGLVLHTVMRDLEAEPLPTGLGTSSSASTSCGARSSPPSRPRWLRAGCWSSPSDPCQPRTPSPARSGASAGGRRVARPGVRARRYSGMMRAGGRTGGTRCVYPPADAIQDRAESRSRGEVT